MGNLLLKLQPYIPYLPYLALGLLTLGLFSMLFSQHSFFRQLSHLPVRIRHQLGSYAHERIEHNPLLSADQRRLSKDLELSRLRFKGEPLTLSQVILLSLISSLIVFFLTVLLSTRYLPTGFQPTGFQPKNWVFNLPADLFGLCFGFLFPRWYLFLSSIKARVKYQDEAPQALLRLASAIRRHPNLETAVKNALPGFPPYTQWLYRQALIHWRKRDFLAFTEVFYWVAQQTNHEAWKEVASYASTASSAGLLDLSRKISLLNTRAQELLGKRKEARKNNSFQIGMSVFAFLILLAQVVWLVYLNPSMGKYLFITAWGRILYALIYVAIFFEVAVFTFLQYKL